MKTWTKEETDILIKNFETTSKNEIILLIPNKSYIGIYKKAKKLGLNRGKCFEFKTRSESRSGNKSPSWKGGKKVNRKGYVMVLDKSHHRADSNGYVLEHIYVFERETGIEIPSNCCIHHLNGDKSDNRIQNLCMMTKAAHTIMHHTGAKRSKETCEKISIKAIERKKSYGK